jgi:surface polysaccharide O-acyltransferase-like enzyme
MAYGAAGVEFYYVELHPSGFSRSLLIFVLGNQAWFMGAFFLVAGYFTPGSFDRKGPGSFLGSRLLRLGIPLVVYALVFNPVSMFGGFFIRDFLNPLTWETYSYSDYVRMGPMWFVALLLIFSFGYAAWRLLTRREPASSADQSPPPGYLSVGVFMLGLAAVSYVVRLQIPVGQTEFGFPSLAYLPQYLSFFVLGVVAYRRDWFRRFPTSMGWVGFGAAAAATIFLFPLAFSGHMFSLELTEALGNAFADDGHWQAVVYTLWDSVLAVGMCLGLIVVFRTFVNRQGSLGGFLARHSYAVYVIHIPVVVFLAVALRNIEVEHLLKVAMVGAIAVPLCFAVAAVVRRIPGASRIL